MIPGIPKLLAANFTIKQEVAHTEIADIGGGQFSGPALAVPAGAILLGFGYVIEAAFDDSGLSGPDTTIACQDQSGEQTFGIVNFDITQADSPWTGSAGSSGFIGQAQTDAMVYKGSGTSPNIHSLPFANSGTILESFPVEFSTAGNLRLAPQFGHWNNDGSQGIIRLYYYVCKRPAIRF